ncbi:MAG TPA: hypothetical protein VN636_15335, partial [Acidimicrobiia bacterium]|nr:hypothetical protein [Acidimicrobiia bacterium]
MSVQGTTKSLNPRAYQIPAVAGGTWNATYTAPGLVRGASGLVALMWAQRRSPTAATQLHSAPVSAWSTATFGVIDLTSTGITPARIKGQAGAGNAVYTYMATGSRAYAVPLSCLTVPAPPLSNLMVEPVPCPGANPCPLNPNDTVFVGQTLKITPTVFSMHALTDWRFDFDWHPATEDTGTSPHLKTPDLAYPSAGAVPPATITLAGPCDPSAGGVPASGAGCWTSVTSNGDFPGSAPAGTTASLTLALEASNDLGSGNTKTFPLTWKVPAVRLATTSVLLGQPLQSAAEGAPLSSGYKWYFGTTPTSLAVSSCTGASCVPPPPYNAKGTYYYWLTVPYASYTSPDCGIPCTQSLGTYTVADVSVFITNVPTTVLASHPVNLTDASSIAAGVTACGAAGWQYSLCDASAPACTAGSGLAWTDIAIPHPGSSSFTAPSTPATYWLRVRYNYTTTGSCPSLAAAWTPAVSGISDITAWPLVVTPVPPMIVVRVNGQDPCPPGPGGGCTSGYPANVGDVVTVWADLQGIGHDPSPPATTVWTFGPTASPSSCTGSGCQGTAFTFTQPGNPTISLSGYPGVASPSLAAFAVDVPPVVARNGGPVCAGSPLPLTASPTITGATYAWTGPNGFTSTVQNPTIPAATTAAAGMYTVVRTLTGQTSQSSTVVVVNTPPAVPVAGNSGPLCAGGTLALTAATVAGATYSWTGPNGFTSSLQNPTITNATPAASGTY